ncbi:uracil-DNA glycosylase family protein [Halosegnis rubeus]|uniref:Uracil-DNA glycosylase n=1 Tax=Halosegnis rubeus TaxID=2212850 RepID=A0A5N5UIY4_9EURY|nr:uracil-DNA glycosylase family protein [Halosegnis rubeus]KAB7518658.1 uracil-DNA glycosylase [Halosegnis rubeus]
METVTTETSNPFGMRIDGPAVYGYGDANADFHVFGDSPARHGGTATGVPFTDSEAGRRLQALVHELGFATDAYADEPDLSNLYLSYIHPGDGESTPASYADQERFLDAELRAINAHILLPVGDRAFAYALEHHTSVRGKTDPRTSEMHATPVRGRGFLVIPVKEPTEWTETDRERLLATLRELLDGDYRQTKGVATTVG